MKTIKMSALQRSKLCTKCIKFTKQFAVSFLLFPSLNNLENMNSYPENSNKYKASVKHPNFCNFHFSYNSAITTWWTVENLRWEKNYNASCCRADVSVEIPSNFCCQFLGSLLASLCMYVCPSFRMEDLGFQWTGFHEIWRENFPKFVRKIQFAFKIWKNNGHFNWRQIYILILSHSFLLRWEILQTNVVEKIKTHILHSTPLFPKSRRLWDNVEKYVFLTVHHKLTIH